MESALQLPVNGPRGSRSLSATRMVDRWGGQTVSAGPLRQDLLWCRLFCASTTWSLDGKAAMGECGVRLFVLLSGRMPHGELISMFYSSPWPTPWPTRRHSCLLSPWAEAPTQDTNPVGACQRHLITRTGWDAPTRQPIPKFTGLGSQSGYHSLPVRLYHNVHHEATQSPA